MESVNPTYGATDVAVNSSISITFSEALKCTSANTSTFLMNSPTGDVICTVACAGSSVTLNPASELAPFTEYRVTVANTVSDNAGNGMGGADYVTSFTTGNTGDIMAPVIMAGSPVDAATGVLVGVGTISMILNEPMDCTTLDINTFTVYNGAVKITGTVDCSGSTATFTIGSALDYSTLYTVTATTGARDLAGNALASDIVIGFTTEADTYAPSVSDVSPLEASTDISRNSVISITFSEDMDCSSFNTGTFTLYQGTDQVSGAVGCSGKTATFTPDIVLKPQAVFTVTVSGAVTDTASNPPDSDKTWNFTTGSGGGTSIWDDMFWGHDIWG